jgi:hypothetical protein
MIDRVKFSIIIGEIVITTLFYEGLINFQNLDDSLNVSVRVAHSFLLNVILVLQI